MRVREFEFLITGVLTGWSRSDVDQRTRRLRKMRMLPTGGRGLNAPAIEAEHAANILIALAAAEKAVGVHDAIMNYAPMVTRPRSPGDFDFLGCKSFAETLTKILDTPAVANRIKEISICRSWPEATIIYQTSEGEFKQEHYTPAGQSASGCLVQNNIVISGMVLEQFAIDLKQPNEDGEWVDHVE